MSRTRDVTEGSRLAPARGPLGVLDRLRRNPPSPGLTVLLLWLLSLGLFLLSLAVGGSWAPPSAQSIPLLLGGLLLMRRDFWRVLVACTGLIALQYALQDDSPPGAVFALGFTAFLAYAFVRSREDTGLGGMRGDAVLVELRGRLEQQGALPVLPDPWHADSLVLPAGEAPFAGDFVVSARTGCRLDIALVDVSGKGVEAGTRSLLLSGALGGLLGAPDGREFLAAGNAYLVRQDWDEGFATAVHVTLNLTDGTYCVASAGHPPAAQFDAGSGRWSLLEAAGPALGLLPDVVYEPVHGVLRPGDALLLYTDGLVEVSGRDLAVGIDKLLGEAERLVTRGFEGGARTLATSVAADSSDDRGLVLIWRKA
jgi:hypothetical protein